MGHKIFAVYDSKAAAYLPPWISENAATAIRRFEASVQNPETDFARFPGDYTLFELGDWDQHSGEIRMNQAHTNLGTALSYLQNNRMNTEGNNE